jgi:exodeoxyribonuclease V alpha subunit
MTEETILVGTVEKVVFSSDKSQFTVLRVRADGEPGLATVVGSIPPLSVGESARFSGAWVRDARFGRQFQARSVAFELPATLKGIERYLASGACKGIGQEMARRLVARFGEKTLQVIDEAPERLLEVEGIGRVRARQIRESWSRERGAREVFVFLQGHDISPRLAMKLWKAYGAQAVERLRENPYAVAGEIEGIGWKTADRIARAFGLPREAPARIEAGVVFLMRERASRGHTGAPREVFEQSAADFLEIDLGAAEEATRRLVDAGRLCVRDDSRRGALLMLPHLDLAEEEVARDVVRIAAADGPGAPEDLVARLDEAVAGGDVELGEQQQLALEAVLRERILVVTGGPGTGKTTLVRSVIRLLEGLGRSVVLAAPTGRAAKRLSEATGRGASTLHRLLEWEPRLGSFARSRTHPLVADAIVVDEASMVDLLLMQALTAAVPDGALLLLVGDTDQLPPVGPGNVLRDLIASGIARVVRLDRIYRQAERSAIIRTAHQVNRGELPALAAGGSDPAALDRATDFHFLDAPTPERSLAILKALVSDAVVRSFRLDPFKDVQVLSPMYRGLLGVENTNRELQALLNPEGLPISRGESSFRIGDKVMQTRNNYGKDVWNGDIGRVAEVDTDARQVLIDFDGRLVAYEWEDLDEITLAYACSVHKAQGSEYRAVVVLLHAEHAVMLRRNLLYTAITRGREWVFLLGERRALAMAVRNTREEGRVTGLAERLRAIARG